MTDFVHYVHTGNIKLGVFYAFEILEYPTWHQLRRIERRGSDNLIRVEGEWSGIYVDCYDGVYHEHACPNGHKDFHSLQEAKFFYKSSLETRLFPSSDPGFKLINSDTKTCLDSYKFNNYATIKLLPDSDSIYRQPMWTINTTGPVISCPPTINGEIPCCLKCEHPLICKFCGYADSSCTACGGSDLHTLSSREELSQVVDRLPPDEIPAIFGYNPPVVDGRKWHGEDFFNVGIYTGVTKRVVEAFRRNSIGPAIFEPLYVNLDGCDASKLKMFEKAMVL